MKEVSFKTSGTCAQLITFKLDGQIIHDVKFTGGCNGNLKAISILCEGMDANVIISKLKGNLCGFKKTSCADQFAKALEQNLAN